MNSHERHRRNVLQAGKLCHICEQQAPVSGRDEFGGYTCQPCRDVLVAARRRNVGYSERRKGVVK